MTLNQIKLIEDYNSLRAKLEDKDVGLMIQFCTYFQSDDEKLYKEFKKLCQESLSASIETEDLINLYAKRYNLSPQTHIEQIMHLFINNAITNGVAYHLNSSANFDSIMENGLGISAIGLKTEERQDYERLQSAIPKETFRKLQPFVGEKKGSKLYYSNKPILKARYGDRPEWLKELKINSYAVEDDPNARDLVDHILHKYDRKYEFAEKMLFLLPNPAATVISSVIDELIQTHSPKQIINYFNNVLLSQPDMYTDQHIPSLSIIAVDLKTHNMYARKTNGSVGIINNSSDFQK